jgi:hypothetical protein
MHIATAINRTVISASLEMSSFKRTERALSSMLHRGLSAGFSLYPEWSCRSRASITLNCSSAAPIVDFLRRKDREMQIRSKAYRHFISICRSLRDLVSPHDQNVPTPTSPLLAYAAAMLALLLAILEVDLHLADLQLIGIMSEGDQDDPIFLALLSP